MFSRLAPRSTRLGKRQCGGDGDEWGERRRAAMDGITACDAHGRNVSMLTALLMRQTDAVIPEP